MMQQLFDDVNDAKSKGMEPPFHPFTWCVFETAKKQPDCRVANPDLPEGKKCNCDKVMKGYWDDGTPRTFDTVCKGRLARSDGWVPRHDLHNTFRLDSQEIWEAQQECVRPSTEGLVIPSFSREIHGVRRWDPDPDNGPIYMSVDFGHTNPHAVNWYQQLRYDVETTGFHGLPKRIPEGSFVCFDEIYITNIGNNKLAEMVKDRERYWKGKYKSFNVRRRFADPQAAAARKDWSADYGLFTSFVATRDVREHIKKVKELFEDRLIYTDVERCPMWCEEIEVWHYPKKRANMIDDPELPVDDFNHCMSDFRYMVANVHQLKRTQGWAKGRPKSAGHKHTTARITTTEVKVMEMQGPGRYVESNRPRSTRGKRERFSPG
jgi:hypothetical protein